MHCPSLLSVLVATGLASAATVPRALTENDILLFGAGGRVEIMNKTDFDAWTMFNITTPTPVFNISTTLGHTNYSHSTGTISARCSTETIFTMNPVSTFLNWDVLMSSVIHASSGDASVMVTEGYSITNTVSVDVSSELTLITDYFSATLSIDYSKSWSSTYSAGYTFTVPSGKYGAVVSNPKTTRNSGSVAIGCVGQGQVTEFTADSYSSQSYGSLSWVEGTISLCTGDSYPMARCHGEGTLS